MAAKVLSDEQQTLMVDELKGTLGDAVHQNLLKGGEEGLLDATCRRWLVRKGCSTAAAE